MKRQIILLATLSLLASSSILSAGAFDTVRPLVPTEVLRQQTPDPSTRDLQKQVLLKVNSALTHGLISVPDATELKGQLDSLGESESWYQTLDKPIPAEILVQHQHTLSAMNMKLDQAPPVPTDGSSQDALHPDIDELISNSLASNKITSNQAEQVYYSHLAQIESGLQAPRDASDRSARELESLKKELLDLKAQLSR